MHLIVGAVLAAALGVFGTAATGDTQPLPEGSYVLPADGFSHSASSWPEATNREPDEPGEPPYATPLQRITITPHRDPDPPDPPRDPRPPVAPARLPAAPPPPPAVKAAARLTLSAARQAVRLTIRRRTGRRPRGLTPACERETDFIVTCRPAWRDARFTYRGVMTVRSRPTGIHASLRGTRAKRSCPRRCRRAIRW